MSVPPDAALISLRLVISPVAELLTRKVIVVLVDAHGASGQAMVLVAIVPDTVQEGSLRVSPVGI